MVKKLFFLLLAGALLLPAGLTAQEPDTFTRYEGERITGVAASSAVEVILVPSTETKVVVEISSELKPHLDLSFEEGVVRVSLQKNNGLRLLLRRRNFTARVTVYLDELTRLEAGGAARVSASGEFKGERTTIRLAGAAKLRGLSLTTGRLTVGASGASYASLSARAEEVDLNFTSSADGRILLNCREIDAECSAAADLVLSGEAKEGHFETSSAARIDAYAFAVERLDADASSASTQRLWATEKLEVSASSAASIRYRGNPRLEGTTSSAASIHAVE